METCCEGRERRSDCGNDCECGEGVGRGGGGEGVRGGREGVGRRSCDDGESGEGVGTGGNEGNGPCNHL